MKSIAGIAVSGVSGVAGRSFSELSLPGLMSSRSLYSMSARGFFFVFQKNRKNQIQCTIRSSRPKTLRIMSHS